MIERYSRPEMSEKWSLYNKFAMMLRVELAVADVQGEMGIIPLEAAQDIRQKSDFDLEEIADLEKTTKHDVIAFVSCVAKKIGPQGRYLHYGLTSSDVVDTALSLQIKEAGELLDQTVEKLAKELSQKAIEHETSLCAGRTHGMHAEPTSFGLKLAGFVAELKRNQVRLKSAVDQCARGKLSGAVGTYSAQSNEVEDKVCQKLNLKPELVATQVIPRDRHAQVLFALALLGAGLERLAVELRHLQRTEVGEVVEGFTPGQKGSSAMPHKKNPISSENITGAARVLRSYLQAGLEDVALWHERDISHSSVERIVFPDAFILTDYAVDRMRQVVSSLFVDVKRMSENMKLSSGHLFSSHVLLALVASGLSREEAYRVVQSHAHHLHQGQNLQESLKNDPEVKKRLSEDQLAEIFSGLSHRQAITQIMNRLKSSLL